MPPLLLRHYVNSLKKAYKLPSSGDGRKNKQNILGSGSAQETECNERRILSQSIRLCLHSISLASFLSGWGKVQLLSFQSTNSVASPKITVLIGHPLMGPEIDDLLGLLIHSMTLLSLRSPFRCGSGKTGPRPTSLHPSTIKRLVLNSLRRSSSTVRFWLSCPHRELSDNQSPSF